MQRLPKAPRPSPSPSAQGRAKQESVGFLVAAARRRIKQAVWQRSEGLGVTAQQFWMVVGLRRRGESSLHELAERIRIDSPTASRLVAGLVKKRLVRNAIDPGDRRRSRLQLTPSGAALGDRLLPIAGAIRSGIEAGFTDDELEQLRSLLWRVIGNAERLAEGGAAKEIDDETDD